MSLFSNLTFKHKTKFLLLVNKGSEDECWRFMGRKNKDGYGEFDVKENRILAHRLAYFLATFIEPDLYVCHDCDLPSCCNPKHLFLGTAKQNVVDSVIKGRHSSVTLLGEDRPNHKLTEKEVEEMRFLRALGWTLQMLASKFEVHFSTVAQVTLRKTWRHI
jgi:hypothetical protein